MDISVNQIHVTMGTVSDDVLWFIEYVPLITVVLSSIVILFIANRQLRIARQQMYASTVSPLREKWIDSLRTTLCNFLQTVARCKELEEKIKTLEKPMEKMERGSRAKVLLTDPVYLNLKKRYEKYEEELSERMFEAGRDIIIINTMLSNKDGEAIHAKLYTKIGELLKATEDTDENLSQKKFHKVGKEVSELAKTLFKQEWEKIKEESTYK